MTDAEKVAEAADKVAYRIANLIPAGTVVGDEAVKVRTIREIAEAMKALSAEIKTTVHNNPISDENL